MEGRRDFMLGLAATAAASGCTTTPRHDTATLPPLPPAAVLATDTAYWNAVRDLYRVTPDIINLENGYWGVMVDPVAREYLRNTEMVNRDSSYYARNGFGRDMEPTRAATATALGCAPDEIAFTRGATEALQLLILTILPALKWHQQIGPQAKQARLKYLRDRWVRPSRGIRGLEILTPDEPGMSAGITSFRYAGKGSAADNNAVVAALRDKHGIFTVRRGGVAKGQCVRVSPALFNTESEMDKLAAALAALA